MCKETCSNDCLHTFYSTENVRWIIERRSCQSLQSPKAYIVFGPRKVIQSNLVGNISYKPGSQIAIICQVFPKTCTYLASNNVNSFSLWAYRIPQVNSSISPFSPTSLRAADAIIFLAPTSFFCSPTFILGPLDGSALSLNPCFHCASSDCKIDLSTGRLWPLIWSDKGCVALTELDNQRGGTLGLRWGCFPFPHSIPLPFSMMVRFTVHLLPCPYQTPRGK